MLAAHTVQYIVQFSYHNVVANYHMHRYVSAT